jgi:hypothetical protein
MKFRPLLYLLPGLHGLGSHAVAQYFTREQALEDRASEIRYDAWDLQQRGRALKENAQQVTCPLVFLRM